MFYVKLYAQTFLYPIRSHDWCVGILLNNEVCLFFLGFPISRVATIYCEVYLFHVNHFGKYSSAAKLTVETGEFDSQWGNKPSSYYLLKVIGSCALFFKREYNSQWELKNSNQTIIW